MREFETLEDIENEYREFSARLLEMIDRRDESRKLLKIARPSMIPVIQQEIARFDEAIEKGEAYLETIGKVREARIELETHLAGLLAFTEKLKPELLKHVAEHHPEKLEEIEILFSDEDSSKTH